MDIIRPVEARDLTALRRWHNNKTLRNNTHGFRFPVNSEMEKAWFDSITKNAAPKKAVFAVQSDDGVIIGLAQLDNIDLVHRNGKLGIFIGDQKTRGKGHGKRALLELIRFGFDDLNLSKIYLYVNASNKHAKQLYLDCEFITEGTLKKHYFLDGSWEDLLIMSTFRNIRQS